MRPFETVDSTMTPDGQVLTLHRHDEDFYIRLDGHELMSSRVHGSEVALAQLACSDLLQDERPKVLVGGLGLGFTLRAALEILPRGAEVLVAEVLPCVIEWNHSYLNVLGTPLDDPRVQVHERDVYDLLGRDCPHPYDIILLDVDNGPSARSLNSNARLYRRHGVTRIAQALAPAGVVAIWSAYRDEEFATRLHQAGLKTTVVPVRARSGQIGYGQGRSRGSRHTIFLARKS